MSIKNYYRNQEEERQQKWHEKKMRQYKETKIMLEIEILKEQLEEIKQKKKDYEEMKEQFDEIS